jgi:GST-like protein
VIDLYTWTTPNGRKASIALEEMGLPYTVHAVDIGKDEQFKPEFLKISPNNRIPAIVDRDNGLSLMESGAILIYLADKCGKLLPKSGEARYRTIEWLMWQMGGPGPMFGQVHHFTKYNPGKAPYAEERYLKEAHRLYGVLDRRLADHEYVADDYSIADIAIWPWVSRYEWQTVDLNKYPQAPGDAEGLRSAEGRRRGAVALRAQESLSGIAVRDRRHTGGGGRPSPAAEAGNLDRSLGRRNVEIELMLLPFGLAVFQSPVDLQQ